MCVGPVILLFALGACQTGQGNRTSVVALYRQGRYAEAVPLARETVAAEEEKRGPNDPEVAAGLNLLALLYYALGDFDRAEPLFRRALQIREAALGPEDVETATSLNNLGLLYESTGDFSRAEPLYKRALSIREKKLEPDHPDIASGLNNLATLYYALGDYEQAIPLLKRSVAIWEKALGKDDPDVAAGLSNLAGLYAGLGRLDEAEPLYERALRIREKKLGPDHPDVAAGLNNLALLHQQKGEYDRAEPLYQRALKILESALGRDHPAVAPTLNNLAQLAAAQGEYERAERLNLRALGIVEKAFGPGHPDVAEGLDNLAGLYATQGKYAQALALFKRAQEIDRELIDQVLGFTSEEKKARFLAAKQSALEGALSLAVRHLIQDKTARADALNMWLGRKGIILEAQRRFQEALVHSDNPRAMKTFQDLARVRAELSSLAFAGPGPEEAKKYRARIGELEERKQRLEADLSRLSQAYALQKKMRRADARAVARALPPGSVLIEFARVNMFDFKARSEKEKWQPPHYLAFVVPAGVGGEVRLYDLGPAEKIDRAVTDFKRAVIDLRDKEGQGALAAASEIYRLVFGPLRTGLGSAQNIFLSPDGNLNLIPFEVLPGPDGRHLIEDFFFNYLSAGRDVLGLGRTAEGGGKPLLIGDPDFDLSTSDQQAALARLGLPKAEERPTARAVDLRGFTFDRLPGTREEVRAIAEIFGADRVDLFTGAEALEEVLYRVKAPRILHLATHGFFLSDAQFQMLTGKKKGGETKVRYVNPLVRSGLALAGANRALAGGGGTTDGVFTAEKVLGLRLRGTDMVVLSACETGLGEIRSGEGVYGLRRAFTQAGAKSLVMSMWSVPDRETQELMLGFYRHITAGMTRSRALRKAVLEQKRIVQERFGHANPFFWGAFVFLGQP